MTGFKIQMVRQLRGYSQDYVASKLGITQSAYSDYETNKTKIKVETLQKIAEVLDVPFMELMSPMPTEINFQTNQGNVIGYVENLISSQKELYEQMIASKDAEIERLVKLLDRFMKK